MQASQRAKLSFDSRLELHYTTTTVAWELRNDNPCQVLTKLSAVIERCLILVILEWTLGEPCKKSSPAPRRLLGISASCGSPQEKNTLIIFDVMRQIMTGHSEV